jgi:hypothetical protein
MDIVQNLSFNLIIYDLQMFLFSASVFLNWEFSPPPVSTATCLLDVKAYKCIGMIPDPDTCCAEWYPPPPFLHTSKEHLVSVKYTRDT